jgi:tetratricopeptide (TPR) repeat protein
MLQGDYPHALNAAEASLALFRETDDRPGTAWCLEVLSALRCIFNREHAEELAEEALTRFRELGTLSGVSHALRALAFSRFRSGDRVRASQLLEEAIEVSQENEALWHVAWCLYPLSAIAPRRAMELCAQALVHARDMGNEEHIVTFLSLYGDLLLAEGEDERARQALAESVALWQRVGATDKLWSHTALMLLGFIELSAGHADQAVALFARDESQAREYGALIDIYEIRFYLTAAQVARGDLAAAARNSRECIQWFHKHDIRVEIVCSLIQMADQARRRAEPLRACRLLGAAKAFEKELDSISWNRFNHFRHWHRAAQRTIVEPALIAARAELGDSVFDSAYTAGLHMTLDQAVAYALQAGEVESRPVR